MNLSAGPKVSVIIPARNEEANLELCLRSLVVQEGVSFEVIVVDDGSTDRTRTIAESFTRVGNCPVVGHNQDRADVELLDAATPLPAGWTGKNNAVWTGAQAAKGEWLLFTDADTEHEAGSLAKSVEEAESQGAALLSYSPEQTVSGFRQSVVMPVIFAELASVYKPKEVSDPKSDVAAANGQYLLIRRDWYDKVGGHGAVAESLLEDVALARNVKMAGGAIRFRLGKDRVHARMYRTWPDLRDGWTKNLKLLFEDAESLARTRLFEFAWMTLLPLFAVVAFILGFTTAAVVALLASLPAWANFVMRIRRAHFGALAPAKAWLGLPIFAWLLLRSEAAHQSGNVAWKGRTYIPGATSGGTGESNP